MPLPLRRLAFCCALLVAPLSASAQSANNSAGKEDLDATQHYTLTVDKETQYGQIFTELAAYVKAHPNAARKLEANSNESLSAAERRIASEPAILARHNFTPREFILFSITLLQAAFASETAKQNGIDPAKMAAQAHINPANMAFVQQHKAEIEAMIAKLKEASEKSDANN